MLISPNTSQDQMIRSPPACFRKRVKELQRSTLTKREKHKRTLQKTLSIGSSKENLQSPSCKRVLTKRKKLCFNSHIAYYKLSIFVSTKGKLFHFNLK